MNECSINDFIKAFKAEFGSVEFKATQHCDGLTVATPGWIEQPEPSLEISGDDYIKLGDLGRLGCPSKGVMQFMFEKLKGK